MTYFSNIFDCGQDNKQIIVGKYSEVFLKKSMSESMLDIDKANIIVEYAISLNNEIKEFNTTLNNAVNKINIKDVDELAFEKAKEFNINFEAVIEALMNKTNYKQYFSSFVCMYKRYKYMYEELVDELYKEYRSLTIPIIEDANFIEKEINLIDKELSKVLDSRKIAFEKYHNQKKKGLFRQKNKNKDDYPDELTYLDNEFFLLNEQYSKKKSLEEETYKKLRSIAKPSVYYKGSMITVDNEDVYDALKCSLKEYLEENKEKYTLYSNALK